MKKTFKALVLMTFTLLTAAIMVFGASANAPLPGDVNGDGKVTVVDSIKILQYLANVDVECVNSALDANGDNVIDGRDSTAILMNIVGWKKDLNYGDSCEHSLTSHPLAPAACTEPGSIEYVSCEKCNKLFLDNTCSVAITAKYTYIKPSGHVEVVDPYVAPTCGKVGSTEGSHCAVCSTVLTASNEVPATGKHDFSAVGNVWLDNANYIEPVCSVCGTASGFRAEGGFSEESNTLMFRECGTDFSFEIICAENEAYIRENLTVVESMFSSLEGELLNAFANEYKLESLGSDRWRVSPAKPYDKRMGYDVLFSDGIELAHFPGRALSFRTAGASSDVEVYRDDILFLRDFENRDPGYYPYTISFDEDAMQYTLTVSKVGIFTEDMIGRVLCVGECTDMVTASKMTSDEVDIGKITAIEQNGDKTVITLGPVDFTDIYTELDVTFGDKEMVITETFTEEERMTFAASILANESFLSAINTAQLAAEDYAAPYGLNVGKIDWAAEAEKLVRMIKITLEEKVINGNSGALLKVGIEDYTLIIPLETTSKYVFATVKFTFTLKDEFHLYLDGDASISNLEYYIKEKIDIFDRDDVKAQFYVELHSINTFTFNFNVSISSDISDKPIYYIVNPNTGTIHADFCKHARKYVNNPNQCYTAKRLEEDFGKNYADKQCQSCKPFTENQSFAICLADKYATVHKNTCSHIPTINEENLYYTYMRPIEGSMFSSFKYVYCADCDPSTAESKSFDECMKDSLESSDWGESLLDLREKIAGELDFELAPQKDPDIAVQLWIFSIKIKVTPVIKFNLEATLDYSFVDITKNTYTIHLRYPPMLNKYTIAISAEEEELTEAEKNKEKNVIDVKGKIDASAGIRLDISIGPVIFDHWFNVDLRTEVGFYADIRGVAHIDFNNQNENYFGGFVKLGIYGEMSAGYVAFGYASPKRAEILPYTRIPLIVFGNDKIFYGYNDYDQSVSIKLSNSIDQYTLNNSILKALYFDLEQMSTSSKELSFSRGSGYKVVVNVVNKSGKVLNYCTVKNGVLHISADAPSEFTAYLKIKVIDTDILSFDDLINIKVGNNLNTSYNLPELTVILKVSKAKYSEGLEFTLNEDGASYSVTGIGSCTDIDLVIPNTYNELPVTNIGDFAFSNCSGLTSITIPDSITSIGMYSFSNCIGLTNITIPESVKSIDIYSFYCCTNLTSIIIPNGVTYLGSKLFSGCLSLKDVTLPNSITDIDWALFESCSSLTSMFIPDGVTYIGDMAFSLCKNLTSITIPNSVTAFGDYSFYGCSSLTSINFTGTIAEWDAIAKGEEWMGDSPLSGVQCKDGYISLTDAAESKGLSFTLNNDGKSYSVTGIGTCTDTDIVIPATYNGLPVTIIGNWAFASTCLTNIVIPDSVTSIGDCAFLDCSSLTSTTIPDSVISIGNDAFGGCSSLTSINLGQGVTSISDGMFSWCSSLTSITIPNSVTSIGNFAFECCESLTNIIIPNSVTSIGDRAFEQCLSLTSIVIPSSVTFIGEAAFINCDELTNISVDKGNAVYHSSGNCIIETQSKTLVQGCNTSIIPNDGSVTSIGNSAFSHCLGIRSIIIPDSVTNIGDWAFSYCNLFSLLIPDSVTNIGEGAFSGNILATIYVEEGNTVYHSSGNCIIETKSKTLVQGGNNSIIPADGSVTSIGNSAFCDFFDITSIIIPDSVTSIGENAFMGCHFMTSIIIPNSVTNIGGGAFIGCRNLTNISIPDSVTSIGDCAFEDCKSMTNIIIPNKVTSIGDLMFSWCSSLTSVTIPDSVTSIGYAAFNDCPSLTNVIFEGTMAQWEAISKGDRWKDNAPFTVVHCTDGDVSVS